MLKFIKIDLIRIYTTNFFTKIKTVNAIEYCYCPREMRNVVIFSQNQIPI